MDQNKHASLSALEMPKPWLGSPLPAAVPLAIDRYSLAGEVYLHILKKLNLLISADQSNVKNTAASQPIFCLIAMPINGNLYYAGNTIR